MGTGKKGARGGGIRRIILSPAAGSFGNRARAVAGTPSPPPRGARLGPLRLDPTRVGAGGVALLCADCEPCELRASRFFVAWSGMLTLAWEGFPPAVAALKRKIARAFPALPEEKPGSRWAKTTLGCLKDGARLTPEALATLAEVCEKHRDALVRGTRSGDRETRDDAGAGEVLTGTGGTRIGRRTPPGPRDDAGLSSVVALGGKGGSAAGEPGRGPVDHLSVVVFQCRSLGRTVSEHVVALGPGPRSRDPPAAAGRRQWGA